MIRPASRRSASASRSACAGAPNVADATSEAACFRPTAKAALVART
jgi:hypothetical protein